MGTETFVTTEQSKQRIVLFGWKLLVKYLKACVSAIIVIRRCVCDLITCSWVQGLITQRIVTVRSVGIAVGKPIALEGMNIMLS
jgi:hypothetical protein